MFTQGYSNPASVYYDAKTGQYYTVGTQNVMGHILESGPRTYINGGDNQASGLFGKNINQGTTTTPAAIPSYMPAGLQVYGSEPVTPAARPTPQARPGTAPQFDMSFLQQLMAQRAQQPAPPAPPAGPPTLTPGQQYGNPAMGGGLAALRAIAGTQPSAPTTPAAPVTPTTGV